MRAKLSAWASVMIGLTLTFILEDNEFVLSSFSVKNIESF